MSCKNVKHAMAVMSQLHVFMTKKIFCDTVIKITEEEFQCHRNVLAASSPWFRRIFNEKIEKVLVENNMFNLRLYNISTDAFRQYMEYVYTGKSKELEMDEFKQIKYIFNSEDVTSDELSSLYLEPGHQHHEPILCVEISMLKNESSKELLTHEKMVTKSFKYKSVVQRSKPKKFKLELPIEPPFTCPEMSCVKVCPTRERLRSHIRHVHAERRFRCESCHAKFVYMKDLITHNRIHTGERPFTCNTCDKSFTQRGTYNTHKRLHDRDDHSKLPCPSCELVFKSQKHLNLHIQYEHPLTYATSKITVESNSASGSESIKKHSEMEVQKNSSVHSSSVYRDEVNAVERKYRRKAKFILPSEPPYLCPVEFCDIVCKTRVKLRSHVRSVHWPKNFLCTECPARFVYEKDLMVHMRVHTKEKPFLCDHCGKSYGQKSSLNAHRRKHGLTIQNRITFNSCSI